MRALTCLLLLAVALPAAADPADPFATAARLTGAPQPAQLARQGAAPCAALAVEAPLSALGAVDLALCRNPQTREAWATSRLQAAQLGVAEAAWLPTVSASLGGGRVFGADNAYGSAYDKRSAALALNWLVYDFGLRSANVESAGQLLAAALASQDATVQGVFLAALQAYYTAQANRAAVFAAGEAERSAQAALAAAELRYQVGAGTPADRLQAQTAAAQATLNRIRAEGEARKALGALAFALGLPAAQPLQLAERPPLPELAGATQDVAALIAEATARRPDLKAADAQLHAAEAGVEAARAAGRPQLALGLTPSWAETAGVTTAGTTLGLTLNVPLFSGFDTTYRVRAAAAQVDVRAAQRDRLANQVGLDVWQAAQSLTTATESLRAAATLVASAEQAERVALGRYKAGAGNLLDLLNAQSALASARLQRIQAELDWNVYRATLAQAVGALDYSLLQTAAEGNP